MVHKDAVEEASTTTRMNSPLSGWGPTSRTAASWRKTLASCLYEPGLFRNFMGQDHRMQWYADFLEPRLVGDGKTRLKNVA